MTRHMMQGAGQLTTGPGQTAPQGGTGKRSIDRPARLAADRQGFAVCLAGRLPACRPRRFDCKKQSDSRGSCEIGTTVA
ncbi:hypothetical protein [Sphingomonas sp. MA1305]|uniref:hypothetical protein n=1 Tax=Sphingomonas sp. MA1305 TaxID=2479204 RepID=UPI0018DF5BA4|nr:hypothetical protein [Sphingomonas sp. MA1305]